MIWRMTCVLACVALLEGAGGCGDDDTTGPQPDSGPQPDAGPLPDAGPPTDLPEGDNGIAASYPDDQGIGADPDVLFLRDHSKFHAGFDVVGSSHNGGSISAHN